MGSKTTDLDRYEVLAAGGVVTRKKKGVVQVLLVHRPKYDDWSYPKGKLDKGETLEHCAFREVLEETGFRCDLLEELSSTVYDDAKGRRKLVRYWHMKVVSGSFEPNKEVDEIRWVPVDELEEHLTYGFDRDIQVPHG